MSEVLKERQETDEQYRWDLSTLFADDAAWEDALKQINAEIPAAAAFQGTLNNAETIRKYFDFETELSRKMENLFTYASLRRSEDTRAQDAQQMYARAYGVYVTLVTATAFSAPEILALSDEQLQAIAADAVMEPYRFTMERFIKRKPHTLSAAEEKLLARFGEVIGAPGQIADSLMDADLVFDSVKDSEGNEHELNSSSYIMLEESEDRTLRENAFRSYYKTYREHINTFASTYSANVKAAAAEAEVRHYGSSREMSMGMNDIPVSVYDNLVSTVRSFLPEMYRYVRLRKRLLGVDELHYYDVYAPLLAGSREKYTYEQAQEMVLNAVAPLGTTYTETVKGAFRDRWIDVYPNKGKSSGAYSSGTYDSNPFILTNFTGSLDSVSTIAHEMGHSMHTWFSKHAQPPQYAGYTLFVAEVASTVNENLLIEQLLEKETDPSKRLAYLNRYLEGFKGTVFRQTMFAEFEKEAHAMAERGEALDPASLSGLYGRLVKDYFGEDLVMDDEVALEWARIPHFYRPFYVYVYATGYTSAAALSEAIRTEGEPAVKRYLEFLSMGGSRYPLDELKHAGVDLNTPAPIETALKKFARVLDDAEKTAAALGL